MRKLRGHPACEVINAGERGTAFLVCDHASNRVPRLLGNLGLEPAQLADHIGWDPGAAEVARRLSGHLDAPLVLSGYSRLAVDCNRPLDGPESITEQSAGVQRTGGIGALAGDRAIRMTRCSGPTMKQSAARPPRQPARAQHSQLHAGARRPASPLGHRHLLRGTADWPRSCSRRSRPTGNSSSATTNPIPWTIDYTIPVPGEGRGLPHVLVEIRQDGIATPADAAVGGATGGNLRPSRAGGAAPLGTPL